VPYPSVPSPGTIRGDIVHFALNKFATVLGRAGRPSPVSELFVQARKSFPIRQVVKDRREALLKAAASNPRANIRYLEKGVVVDVCINAFKRLTSTNSGPPNSSGESGDVATRTRASNGSARVPVPALLPERWVELADPPLCGRIDLVATDYDGDEIVDFKTGVEQAGHLDQIDFYSFLWAKTKGRPVKQRTIVYPNGNRIDRGELSVRELRRLENSYKARFVSAMNAISGEPTPSPSPASCTFCGVRQLCDSYWGSPETSPLRWNAAAPGESQTARWEDCELALRDCTTCDNVICTSVLGSGGQPLTLYCIVPQKYMEARTQGDIVLRLLNVLCKSEGGQVKVVWGPLSEAYWK
jgi:CRISPR/Cas system-associated exonuclease Cas4 (RecB family)